MSRSNLLSLLAMVLVTLAAFSQTPAPKPDFSGRWRMIKDKSEFSGFKTPDLVTRSVEQRGVIINVHTVQTLEQKTSIADVLYNLDGEPTQNVVNGRNAESKTFWDGNVLVIRTSMKTASGDPELVEDRWALSGDKDTLTTTSHIETAKGEVDMTLVCGRQK
jgi:hypothetical protein